MPATPEVLSTLIDRFDPSAFDAPSGRARLRLAVDDVGDWDIVVNGSAHGLEPAEGRPRPDARLCADRATWARVASDLRGGMNAFRRGRLQIRDDLHLGVGFLAATSGSTDPARLEMARVRTALGDIAVFGNSMGGRVALEVGFRHPDRVERIVCLSPSLAWLRDRKWAPLVKALRPELGLLQIAPRPVVEAFARRFVPGGRNGWSAVGVDEFLRAYLTPRGRAAFYAALRNIYRLVPIAFRQRRQVRE